MLHRHVDVFVRWTSGRNAGYGLWIGGTDPARHPERYAELLALAVKRASWAGAANPMRVVVVTDDGEG